MEGKLIILLIVQSCADSKRAGLRSTHPSNNLDRVLETAGHHRSSPRVAVMQQGSFLAGYLPFSSSTGPEKSTTALLRSSDVRDDVELGDLKTEGEDLSETSVEDSEQDDESGSNNSMVLTRRPNAGESNDAASQKQTMNERTPADADNSSSPSTPKKSPTTPTWVYTLLVIMVAVTILAIPNPLHVPHGEQPTVQHVFYYGWLTAVSTGLGAVPFALCPTGVDAFWVGVSNGT